jgi:glyoxylase-like metal-dependent hydrolase (beta-lactamase superfamily II)
MYFRQMPHAATGALCYLIADLAAQEAVLVDPQAEQTELLLALLQERELRLIYVLRTHIHCESERCGGLCEYTGAQRVSGGRPVDARSRSVGHGDTLVFGHEVLRVLATPGHTPDAVSFLWRDRLFCGDALHPAGCPQPVDETDAGQWYDSVTRRLFLLPDETLVFPGHVREGRTVSTIAEERQRNSAFACISRETFINAAGRPAEAARAGAPHARPE